MPCPFGQEPLWHRRRCRSLGCTCASVTGSSRAGAEPRLQPEVLPGRCSGALGVCLFSIPANLFVSVQCFNVTPPSMTLGGLHFLLAFNVCLKKLFFGLVSRNLVTFKCCFDRFFYIKINTVYLSLNTDNTCGSSKGSTSSDCEQCEGRAITLLPRPVCVNFGIFIFFLSPPVFGAFKIQNEELWFFSF